MKKAIIIVLTVLLVFSAVSCGNNNVSDSTAADSAPANESGGSVQSTAEELTETEVELGEITFTGMTVVDNEYCSIKITGLDPDSVWGYAVNVELENKTRDKAIRFSSVSAYVNGSKCDVEFYKTIASEEKATGSVIIIDDVLKENGISDYTEIILPFRASDDSIFSYDGSGDLAYEEVRIYPYGEDKAVKFVRTPLQTDNVLADNEYATVTVTGYETDDNGNFVTKLFVLNKSDESLVFSFSGESVNGFNMSPVIMDTIRAGSSAFMNFSIGNSTLMENNVEVVEKIEFRLIVMTYKDFNAGNYDNKYVSEKITLCP